MAVGLVEVETRLINQLIMKPWKSSYGYLSYNVDKFII